MAGALGGMYGVSRPAHVSSVSAMLYRWLLRRHLVGARAERGRLLQRQERRPDIGYSVGGGYDVYARLIARHIGKHIPGNPTVVPKNMEGAGSLRLANWLYNVGPKDGTVFGTIGRGTGFDPLLGNKAAQFDGTKFNWIGSANDEVSVCVAWNDRGSHQVRGPVDQAARSSAAPAPPPTPTSSRASSTACSAPR